MEDTDRDMGGNIQDQNRDRGRDGSACAFLRLIKHGKPMVISGVLDFFVFRNSNV